MMVLPFIKNKIAALKDLIFPSRLSFAFRRFSCEIKDFDLKEKEVIIYCYSVRIITITSSIAEVVGDPNIIVNLPPYQACWLGYYYGRLCAKSSDGAAFYAKGGSFLLTSTRGKLIWTLILLSKSMDMGTHAD